MDQPPFSWISAISPSNRPISIGPDRERDPNSTSTPTLSIGIPPTTHETVSNGSILIPPFRFSAFLPKLYRGSHPQARNVNFLKSLRLKTIVSLTPESPVDIRQVEEKEREEKEKKKKKKKKERERKGRVGEKDEDGADGGDEGTELGNDMGEADELKEGVNVIRSGRNMGGGPAAHPDASALLSWTLEQNVRVIHLQCDRVTVENRVPLTEQMAVKVIELILNPSYHPLYLHCLDGTDITSLIVACVRKLDCWEEEGWMDELIRFTRDPIPHPSHINFVRTFLSNTMASFPRANPHSTHSRETRLQSLPSTPTLLNHSSSFIASVRPSTVIQPSLYRYSLAGAGGRRLSITDLRFGLGLVRRASEGVGISRRLSNPSASPFSSQVSSQNGGGDNAGEVLRIVIPRRDVRPQWLWGGFEHPKDLLEASVLDDEEEMVRLAERERRSRDDLLSEVSSSEDEGTNRDRERTRLQHHHQRRMKKKSSHHPHRQARSKSTSHSQQRSPRTSPPSDADGARMDVVAETSAAAASTIVRTSLASESISRSTSSSSHSDLSTGTSDRLSKFGDGSNSGIGSGTNSTNQTDTAGGEEDASLVAGVVEGGGGGGVRSQKTSNESLGIPDGLGRVGSGPTGAPGAAGARRRDGTDVLLRGRGDPSWMTALPSPTNRIERRLKCYCRTLPSPTQRFAQGRVLQTPSSPDLAAAAAGEDEDPSHGHPSMRIVFQDDLDVLECRGPPSSMLGQGRGGPLSEIDGSEPASHNSEVSSSDLTSESEEHLSEDGMGDDRKGKFGRSDADPGPGPDAGVKVVHARSSTNQDSERSTSGSRGRKKTGKRRLKRPPVEGSRSPLIFSQDPPSGTGDGYVSETAPQALRPEESHRSPKNQLNSFLPEDLKLPGPNSGVPGRNLVDTPERSNTSSSVSSTVSYWPHVQSQNTPLVGAGTPSGYFSRMDSGDSTSRDSSCRSRGRYDEVPRVGGMDHQLYNQPPLHCRPNLRTSTSSTSRSSVSRSLSRTAASPSPANSSPTKNSQTAVKSTASSVDSSDDSSNDSDEDEGSSEPFEDEEIERKQKLQQQRVDAGESPRATWDYIQKQQEKERERGEHRQPTVGGRTLSVGPSSLRMDVSGSQLAWTNAGSQSVANKVVPDPSAVVKDVESRPAREGPSRQRSWG